MRRWYFFALTLALAFALQPVARAQRSPAMLPDNDFESRQERLWTGIKTQLVGPDGERYWTRSAKDAKLPGGAVGIDEFEGTLVSSAPPDHPNEFMVAIGDDSTPEAKLVMQEHLEKRIPAGSPVTCEGIARAYQTNPYVLTFEVEGVNRITEEEAKRKKRETPEPDKK
jgi:hypothetical protein